MLSLTNKQLKKILKKIERNKNLNQAYSSKWHKIVNFLYSNTGLSIAKVAKGGSDAKQTYYIVESTSKIYIRNISMR